uniref:Uncharacterized protein n=1 Tax=Pyrodinium bahamense TaxID=73915 RepID=A0A7S0FCN4_9DINO|mmetsp:Transcript_2151/g.6019  ORF Transcript_2151/g.6019 Transcript_2151/m.6019 type:complete len:688 (+) Transcript_2151:81-2144(+)
MSVGPVSLDAHAWAEPPLHKASADGDALLVLKLLVQGANPNAEDAVFGEPPLFEAAVADSVSVVVLLLLFGADARRRGRHTSAAAAEFAPAGSAVAQLLDAVVQGDSQGSMELASAAVAPVLDAVSLGSPEALILDWRLKAMGLPGVILRADAAISAVQVPSEGRQTVTLPPAPPVNVFAASDHRSRDERSKAWLAALLRRSASRRANQLATGSAVLFSSSSATARVAWATVAVYAPREALSRLPAASGALAEILLDESDDGAWRHTVAQVAYTVIAHDSRRRALNGRLLSWRETFQEVATQQLFSWGVDGTVTGFGARAPQKAYSRPCVLNLVSTLGSGQPVQQPVVSAIACGRRHNAVATFGGDVYVWGRDVLPPAPQDDVVIGLVRGRMKSRATARDRPQRLAHSYGFGVHSSADAALSSDGSHTINAPDSVLGASALTATLSATLLQLAGGWTAPGAELQENGTDARDALQLPPELPPSQKVVRGASFNVALTCDGRCFVWRRPGLSLSGAANGFSEEPKPVLPLGEVAVDIAVGEAHAAVLTERGRVWTFGWRPFSALGRGPSTCSEAIGMAAPITSLERIVQISAGATFTLCVDVEGTLWLFGEGPCIIGCFGDPHAVYEPRRVPAAVFGGRRVLAAACGEGHVLVLTAWDPCCRLPQPGAWFTARTDCGASKTGALHVRP